ncbi:hypothetical protein HMPREF1008_00570 [Olsenella sp. oral taxon 809 str. F0356]|uniref:hypothetical protein n=1 Tax=Olsenella sp. oral taxon 809 TaxID=661086 RepID=UPI000231EC89|nr:hypothetical protein [Olsenella sp. oral taxon 809]EHF02925.1 hypothetical protein HMPREF1008_00570 [Olsenella sp. oral taxon 809 str. F0356]
MAYEPNREDYQRLSLQFMRSADRMGPLAAARAFAGFGRRFSQDRDSLPQDDADRAFGLVARATTVIDYELPFSDDDKALELIKKGHELLDEALLLDEHCFDALRMQQASQIASFDGYYDFLRTEGDDVRAWCLRQHEHALKREGGERGRIAANLALRPFIRWRAMQASKAVICGRNKDAIDIARELMRIDPDDEADVRYTALIALAKVEDEQGLEELCRKGAQIEARRGMPATQDAWTQLARIALAYKSHDLVGARDAITRLAETHPNALSALAIQRELPDGVFSRLVTQPRSEDELILAISESTVLLQEGRDKEGRGALGAWLREECLGRLGHDERAHVFADEVEWGVGREAE